MNNKNRKSVLNIVLLIILVPMFIVLFYQGTTMNYKVKDGIMTIKWFKGVNIPVNSIAEEPIILENTPKMNKIIGVDMFNIKQGTYNIEGYGNVKLYANNINRKLVIIKTQNSIYGITPENAEEFVKILGF